MIEINLVLGDEVLLIILGIFLINMFKEWFKLKNGEKQSPCGDEVDKDE